MNKHCVWLVLKSERKINLKHVKLYIKQELLNVVQILMVQKV